MPVAREGWAFILPPVALAAIAALTGHPIIAFVLFVLALFLLSFFRDPERVPEGGEETIVSPADGTVLSVTPAPEAPAGASRRLSIFMSVFNVHVNRAPVSGEIADYVYSPGRLRAAFQEKASTENEQNRITLASPRGGVTFKQIAGAVARRIVFYPRVGERLWRGQRIGMIRLGSRVDLFIPDDAEVLIARGDKVRAGKTAIARWKA
ncbi:MAG TPA: phosphatidylserine decarboxylase family protein [Thermoanaerobaculia bacterium]|nr:phosphatidylserine decarboxylase family protein [Thermoanaerobaculia bacterium]